MNEDSDFSMKKHWRLLDGFSGLVLVVGLVASATAWWVMDRMAARNAREEARAEMEKAFNEAHGGLRSYILLLAENKIAIHETEDVNEAAWQAFLQHAQANMPQILSSDEFLFFVKRPAADSQELCGDFAVSTASVESAAAMQRICHSELAKAVFLNTPANATAATRINSLYQAKDQQFVLVTPINSEKDHSIKGWLGVTVNLKKIYGTFAQEGRLSHIEIRDITKPETEELIFSASSEKEAEAIQTLSRSARDRETFVRTIPVGVNTWMVSSYVTLEQEKTPIYAALAGITLTLFSYTLLVFQGRIRLRAERIAEQMTRSLRENDERFEIAINGSADAIWDWDMRKNRLWVSDKFLDIIEDDNADISQFRTLADLAPHLLPEDVDTFHTAIEAHLAGNKRFDVDVRLLHKDRSTSWVRVRGAAIKQGGQPIRMAGAISDIDVMKQQEADLVRAREAAQTSNKAKSDFLANMSHEIRTPLNGIVGIIELMKNTNLDAKQTQYTEIMRSSSHSLLNIVNDILDISKIEAGKMKLELISFDLQNLAEELIELLRPKTAKVKLDLIFRYKPGLPRRFISDPTRIRQIVMNLLSNAIKFTSEGFVYLDIDGEQQANGSYALRIAVKDTGIGIDKDKLKDVFEKFTQADASTTRKYGGTGLGLSIVLQLADLLGGKITVESELKKGSIFTLHVPLMVDAKQPQAIPEHATLQGLRAIAVDDSVTNCVVLTEILHHVGMQVDHTTNPTEALDLLKSAAASGKAYDFAILDFHMPHKDGITLAKEIKAESGIKDTRLVMITSMSKKGDGEEMTQAGFEVYLQKPVIADYLYDALALLIHSQKAGQELPLVTRHTIAEAKALLKPKPKQTMKSTSGLHALLVEDNSTNQYVGGVMLEEFGIVYDIASNGAEAVELARTKPYDLILMDYHMPQMNGIDATKAIRKLSNDNSRTMIVALTGNSQVEDIEACKTAGMNDFLTKPITADNLRDMMVRNRIIKHSQVAEPTKHAAETVAAESGPTPKVEDTTAHYDTSVIDFKRLQAITQNNKERLRKLYEVFCKSFDSSIQNIEANLANEDFESIMRDAHAIKGASSNLYATTLRVACANLEELAQSKEYLQCADALSSVKDAYEDFRDELERLLDA